MTATSNALGVALKDVAEAIQKKCLKWQLTQAIIGFVAMNTNKTPRTTQAICRQDMKNIAHKLIISSVIGIFNHKTEPPRESWRLVGLSQASTVET